MHLALFLKRMAVFLAVSVASYSVAADVFRFKDGRVLFGQVVRKEPLQVDQRTDALWTLQIEQGSYIQIYESELDRNGHEPLSTAETDYVSLMSQSPPQTAQEHCDLAGWCLGKGLRDLARAHFERALDLDPNHSAARAAAGHMKDSDGRWVKKEVVMGEKRGKVLYKGRWRFPEDVVIEQAQENIEEEIAPLKKELNTWHRQAAKGRSEQAKRDAIASIQQLQDPRQAVLLAGYLLDARDPSPLNIRLLYVNVLSRFPVAAQALTTASLTDPDSQVRNACLDALMGFGEVGRNTAVPTYLNYLGNADNVLVNRAAEGLAQFGNPLEAVLPLIYAVITEHEVTAGGGAGMNVNTQGGLSFGGGPKTEKRQFNNASVLATLSQITRQNFGYDKAQWLAWYAGIHAAAAIDLRRDS